MSENREEILANFQACTGIEDVAEALYHLEETNWDLLRAINRVMPQETQTLPSESQANTGPDIEIIDMAESRGLGGRPPSGRGDVDEEVVEVGGRPRRMCRVDTGSKRSMTYSGDSFPSTSSLSSQSSRLLNFQIHFKNRIVNFKIPDTETVGDLKAIIHAELDVPSCRQELRGWKRGVTSPPNSATLASLSLPLENNLHLSCQQDSMALDSSLDSSRIAERLAQEFTLNVRDETRDKNYCLKFPGTRTVLEVKGDVHSVTDIPVRHQVWTGWPQRALDDDSVTLAFSGIDYPTHKLSVRKAVTASHPTSVARDNKKIVIDLADSDNSSVEEFEDASESFNAEDDMSIMGIESKRMQPLIPDNVEDEASASFHFTEQFRSRYGRTHPVFFQGCLDDAVKEACSKPAKERRLLALYLHHEASVLTNVFCAQLLCAESIISCLTSNFVLWGWDITFESNRNKLLASVSRSLGSMASMTIQSIEVEQLPALIIVMRARSVTEIFTVIHGSISVHELLPNLIQAVDVFEQQQRLEIKEEEERAARELVKREQDEAYFASLEADRAKEEAKMIEDMERKRLEQEKEEVEKQKEAHRLQVQSSLPEEPGEGAGDFVTKIRFRLPSEKVTTRLFLINTKLKVLMDYLVVLGYPQADYKVLTSWPRRDLTEMDQESTLQELNLYPQETVILEER
ncbi:FAS-associated factor 1 [Ischnura elegans]|uniref:FAS-associated factor 1 n=1 Tax=Ischnura elegans TaxID=197161 RepID=UPI001ED87144|nr:FAS-associated factor 1 [Ischnura elegans]XP_046388443.1 FAS-associated factor 1 [Ischnura elegans]